MFIHPCLKYTVSGFCHWLNISEKNKYIIICHQQLFRFFRKCVWNMFFAAQLLEQVANNTKVIGSVPKEHTYWQDVLCLCWMHSKSLWIQHLQASCKKKKHWIILKQNPFTKEGHLCFTILPNYYYYYYITRKQHKCYLSYSMWYTTGMARYR